MYDYSKLYGKIREVFETQENFAEAMKMSRTAINARLTQKIQWRTVEIAKACELLHIPLAEAYIYFFSFKSLEITTF